MKIEVAPPPNFEAIATVFPLARLPGVIFAYGNTIYNPSGGAIPKPLIAHELVHCERQLSLRYAPKPDEDFVEYATREWWRRYLDDPEFRYNEELKAHVAEYRAQLTRGDRNLRAKLLMSTAQRLTAPLYAYGSKAPSLSVALSHLRYELEHGHK